MMRVLTDEEVKRGAHRISALYQSEYVFDNLTAILMDTRRGDFGLYESTARVKADVIMGWLRTLGVDIPVCRPK